MLLPWLTHAINVGPDESTQYYPSEYGNTADEYVVSVSGSMLTVSVESSGDTVYQILPAPRGT